MAVWQQSRNTVYLVAVANGSMAGSVRRPDRSSVGQIVAMVHRAVGRGMRTTCSLSLVAAGCLLLPGLASAQPGGGSGPVASSDDAGTATVVSRRATPLREAPVITDVVTRDQIRRMGARTLNDVLLTLPGFSRIQDHNEYYSAMRGIYASSQQKILVLRNGHRLNSRSYAEANFGPAISLANVARIEVMRGPGSVLYGDLALTAVINIVMVEGQSLRGVDLTTGLGDYGQRKVDVVAGTTAGRDGGVLVWGSLFRTSGETRYVDASSDYAPRPRAGSVWLDRFQGPAHDAGFAFTTSRVEVSYATRYEHYASPRAGGGGYGQLFALGDVRPWEGAEAGLSSEFQHFEAKWTPAAKRVSLTFRPYVDTFVFRDNEVQRRADEVGSDGINTKGYFMKWTERAYGVEASATRSYATGGWGHGRILGGGQVERMQVLDSWDVHSPDAGHAAWWVGEPQVLKPGAEQTASFYSMADHRLRPSLAVNAGLRLDRKNRLTGAPVHELSSQASIVYVPDTKWNLRVSHARSFADAPYWYRYNQLGGGYAGGVGLRPERLSSLQISAGLQAPRALFQEVNLVFNRLTNGVVRSASAVYSNAGQIESRGLEYTARVRTATIDWRANWTYQLFNSVSGLASQDGYLDSIPRNMLNSVVAYAPLSSRKGMPWASDLWVNLGVRYIGRQFSPWGKSPTTFANHDPNFVVDARTVLDLGLNMERVLGSQVTVRFNVYNLLDARYRQGGSVNLPYEQPGRWWLLQTSYEFR